jgi:SulP family sulfate permease
VVFDLSASPMVDLAGARMLETMQAALKESGATLRLVEARAAVRDILRAQGLEERVGPIDRKVTVADAVDGLRAG